MLRITDIQPNRLDALCVSTVVSIDDENLYTKNGGSGVFNYFMSHVGGLLSILRFKASQSKNKPYDCGKFTLIYCLVFGVLCVAELMTSNHCN